MRSLLDLALTNAILALLLALTAWAASRFFRRSTVTHILWTLVLIKLLTPPVVQFSLGWSLPSVWTVIGQSTRESVEARWPTSSLMAWSRDDQMSRLTHSVGGWQDPHESPSLLQQIPWSQAGVALMVCWVAVSGAWFTLQGWRIWQFSRWVGVAELAPPEVQAEAHLLARRLGLRTAPPIRIVDGVFSPMVWAVGPATTILFPRELLARMEAAARHTLLTHELAHCRRRDHWVRVLELLATGLYWWNPVVWWARREIEIAEEECCDACVVSHFSAEPRRYAEALLTTIDFLAEARPCRPAIACGLGDVPFLRQRLTHIMRGPRPQNWTHAARGVCLLMAALLPVHPVIFGGPLQVVVPPVATEVAR